MLKSLSVAVDVPLPRDRVYEFLDVMAAHETFTDHFLTDWHYSGPERGVGAKAAVTVKSGRVTDDVEIEVVEARPPLLIRERNVGARGRRVAYGTYELAELPGGGTRVSFTYTWERAPAVERLLAPIVRATMRGLNQRALDRLAERLAGPPA
ncbi:MAG TPA: SRPBCC family protein [Streptosporangiaceae bacterium]